MSDSDPPVPTKVVTLTSYADYEKFQAQHRKAVVFYGASWCQACHDITPLYHQIANRYYKRVAMAYVDIEATDLDFTAIPVVITYQDGAPVNKMRGANKETLRDLIKELLTSNRRRRQAPSK
jgi:thioredoxin-like negative regulator of GroEL